MGERVRIRECSRGPETLGRHWRANFIFSRYFLSFFSRTLVFFTTASAVARNRSVWLKFPSRQEEFHPNNSLRNSKSWLEISRNPEISMLSRMLNPVVVEEMGIPTILFPRGLSNVRLKDKRKISPVICLDRIYLLGKLIPACWKPSTDYWD